MDTLAVDEFRAIMNSHWAFGLFHRFRRFHYAVVSFGVSLIVYVVGAIASIFAGALTTYVTSFPPYMFLAGLTLGLMAHGWWVNAMTRMMSIVYPAFDTTPEGFKDIARQWDRHWLNRPWAIALFGLPIAISNLNDILSLWASEAPGFVWAPWVHSLHSTFFGVWYGLLHVGVSEFVLGSGLAGIIATVMLIRTIARRPLRLAHYRQLESAGAVGVGLAIWTFIALAAVALFTRPTVLIDPKVVPLIVSTAIQTALASLALIVVFGLPLYTCRNAIKDSKAAHRLDLQRVADRIYADMRNLAEQAARTDKASRSDAAGPNVRADKPPPPVPAEQFEALQKQLDTIHALIKEIDDIPTWPISISAVVQLVSSALLPVATSVVGSWLEGMLKGS